MRASVALVSVLLVLSAALASVSAGAPASLDGAAATDDRPRASPDIVAVDNATNYLAVPDGEVRRSATVRTGLDASTAVTTATTEMEATMLRRSFVRSYEGASSKADKAAVLRTYASQLERRQRALRQRDNGSVTRFANGSISARSFVRTRARIHAEAERLREATQSVSEVVLEDEDYTPQPLMRQRLSNLTNEFQMHKGPVSNRTARIAGASGGASEQMSVYAETSSTGYTIATVDDGTYQRETYLGDQRRRGAIDRIATDDEGVLAVLANLTNEFYHLPDDKFVSRLFGQLGNDYSTMNIYRFQAGSQGDILVAYIDGGSKEVFREHQVHPVESFETLDRVRATNGTLAVTLNRTYATGPMSVSVSRSDTGVAVPANVTVDGTRVGSTGDDGRLWVVEPRGDYAINVTARNGDRLTYRASG